RFTYLRRRLECAVLLAVGVVRGPSVSESNYRFVASFGLVSGLPRARNCDTHGAAWQERGEAETAKSQVSGAASLNLATRTPHLKKRGLFDFANTSCKRPRGYYALSRLLTYVGVSGILRACTPVA